MYKIFESIYTKHLNNIVLYYAGIYGFDMGEDRLTSHNNAGDAFKHCFMSAELTLWLGSFISKYIGIKHEDSNKQNPEKERKMDLWNNRIGIEIGKKVYYPKWFLNRQDIYDRIASETMINMKKGNLIISLEDERIN